MRLRLARLALMALVASGTIVLLASPAQAAARTGYRLSSGAPDTLHADFWNTWQQGALERLVTDCLNGGIGCGKQIG